MNEIKKAALHTIDAHANTFTAISGAIWDEPELSLKEFKAAALYTDALEKLGFTVQKNLCGIETAFSGSYGSGHPVIGILGEFDALSGLSQQSGVAEAQSVTPGGNGHGCGHNLLGAGSLAAAAAVKEYLAASGKSGTVVFFGCPGEEGGAAKAYMAREGLWYGLDAALTWHPSDTNEVSTGTNNSCIQVLYKFHGVAAHAAGDPHNGRSALDAVELMNIGVQFLREHMTDDLVVVSLALSVTLFNALCAFVGGFSMEKYVSFMTCADFIVSTPDYFRYNPADEFITPEQIEEIAANTKASLSGTGYAVRKIAYLWMTEDALRQDYARYESAEQLDSHMSRLEHRGNMVMGDTRIEALDNSLFDKLRVFDGDISPMLEPNNNAIAIAVSLDDYGNLPNPEYYPKVGDTITATYADDVKYIDSRTGELCTEDTPEEYLQEKLYGARDVAYTVCALVELPYSMSYRYGGIGYETVLSVDTAQRDSGGAAIPMLYLFDTADEADETEAEQYLSKLTAGEFSPLMYESKATVRSEFAQFRQMFLLIGGILCAIIGLVGLLNFFNAMMTGILSRRREFAVLQAVGMTNRQLKTMLIYEGLFYAMSSVAAAFMLSLAVGPLAGKMLGSMFWFFEYRFTILPVLLTIPVFLLLGWLIPCMMYDNAAKCSVVEQLRDAQ